VVNIQRLSFCNAQNWVKPNVGKIGWRAIYECKHVNLGDLKVNPSGAIFFGLPRHGKIKQALSFNKNFFLYICYL
jgi:hypothetical protein